MDSETLEITTEFLALSEFQVPEHFRQALTWVKSSP